MQILRAGITGCLAGIMNPNSVIFDTDKEVIRHKAILRFRSDTVSKVTNIPFKEINVTKHIYLDGEYVNPTPYTSNLYSLKVTNGVYKRSITKLEPVKRWLAPNNFHELLLEKCSKRIVKAELKDVKFGVDTISTLPLFDLLRHLNIDSDITIEENFNEVYVTTILIDDCDVNQTVYFPGFETPVYRASIECDRLIIESIDRVDDGDIIYVLDSFGVNIPEMTDLYQLNYKQKIGKIAPVDDSKRKDIIFRLTRDYHIYSLGRTAIWKNILLDDCIQDIQRISAMINKTDYEKALGK